MIEVVGIGDDGWEGLDSSARQLVSSAPLVVAGARHLAMLPDIEGQERRVWPSPLRDGLRSLIGDSTTTPVVLASGDPLLSGVASTLVEEFGAHAVHVRPALSSETLARARMGWSAESVDVITLVGRTVERFVPFVTPGARLVILCSDGEGPAQIAALATRAGAGAATLTAWWHLGGPNEGSRAGRCDEWSGVRTPDLVVACLEVTHVDADLQLIGPSPGRGDEAFDHDGLITKRDVRACALARLRPLPGQTLWDLGAGSGAVGIEWTLAAARARVVAVERDERRAERIRANASRCGVSSRVEVAETTTHDIFEDADRRRPDAVFLGGGIAPSILDSALDRLRPAGRLVAHAVTVETETVLLAAQAAHGGQMTRISLEHLEPLGRLRGWKPARSIVQWSLTKPARSALAPRDRA